jgi:hypothetical protein
MPAGVDLANKFPYRNERALGFGSNCGRISHRTTWTRTMVANAESSGSAGATKDYVPADGSWVAELEEAKDELAELLRSEGQAENSKLRGEALKVHLRLCRAYGMLRQWEKLDKASTKGLQHCSSYTSPRSVAKVSPWKARFQTYRDQAQRELAVPTSLNNSEVQEMLRKSIKGRILPNNLFCSGERFSNSNGSQHAAVNGDIRLMEALVALGVAIDLPFLKDERTDFKTAVVAPTDATGLVMACVNIAMNDLDLPRRIDWPKSEQKTQQTAACAMQLVRLGADPTRSLHLCNASETPTSKACRACGLDGKSALELAKLSKRKELVELMEEHLRYTPQERAEVVHCRCGSRLPWKDCHNTGIGQPPHYVEFQPYGIVYRVSPLAHCPCNNNTKTHYQCCWKDTFLPRYLIDTNGKHMYRQARHTVTLGEDPGLADDAWPIGLRDEAAHRCGRRPNDIDGDDRRGAKVAGTRAAGVRRRRSQVPDCNVGHGRVRWVLGAARVPLHVEGPALEARHVGIASADQALEQGPAAVLRRHGATGRREGPRGRQAPGEPVRALRAGGLRRLREGGEGVPALLQVQIHLLLRSGLPKEGLGGAP